MPSSDANKTPPPRTWAEWTRRLTKKAATSQEDYAAELRADATGYWMIVDDEHQPGPVVRGYGSFGELADAFAKLPATCMAVPFYGAVFHTFKGVGNSYDRYIAHPSGVIRPAKPVRLELSADFYVGRGPAEVLITGSDFARDLPPNPAAGDTAPVHAVIGNDIPLISTFESAEDDRTDDDDDADFEAAEPGEMGDSDDA